MKTKIYGVASQGIWVGEAYETEAEAQVAWRQLTDEGYGGLTIQNMEVELPFNLAAHDALTKAGYTYKRVEESWEDVGDPENGPELAGGPAFDVYTDADSRVMVSETNTAFEWRDLELEKHLDAMAAAQGYGQEE